MRVAKTLKFDSDLIEKIDAARGDIPFTVWVYRACEQKLEQLRGIERLLGPAPVLSPRRPLPDPKKVAKR